MTDIKNDGGLLPCPFCGGDGEILKTYDDGRTAIGCKGGNCNMLCEISEDAIKLWNTRHNPQPTEVCYNCCQILTYSEKNVKLINTDNPPNSFDLVKMSHDGKKHIDTADILRSKEGQDALKKERDVGIHRKDGLQAALDEFNTHEDKFLLELSQRTKDTIRNALMKGTQ